MKRRDLALGAMASGIILSCKGGSGGNRDIVDYVRVVKRRRKLYLYDDGEIIKSYDIHLGFSPQGHKTQEGDGKTPEGRYRIWAKNPNSSFYLSLGISYPNQQDRAYAQARNVSPGGDIFIHGGPVRPEDKGRQDWTAGCIAVTNAEMREIYRLVKVGAVIDILP